MILYRVRINVMYMSRDSLVLVEGVRIRVMHDGRGRDSLDPHCMVTK